MNPTSHDGCEYAGGRRPSVLGPAATPQFQCEVAQERHFLQPGQRLPRAVACRWGGRILIVSSAWHPWSLYHRGCSFGARGEQLFRQCEILMLELICELGWRVLT